MHTYKWVVSGERYFSKYNPTGDPIAIPINNFNTKFQSILFQTYGIIKILMKTSSINMMGTISIAGSIKEKPEMQVALFLLVTSIQPAVIRGSLAALFFLTDVYAFILSFFGGIVDMTTIYRTFPLIVVLPIGVFMGNKFFIKSREQLYRKVVFYFLIVISIFGILRILTNI